MLACAALLNAVRVVPHPGPVATLSEERLGPGPETLIEARFSHFQSALSAEERRLTARAIVDAAEEHGVETSMVLAVIYIESGYYNLARSHVGALGLMQVMPKTGQMVAAELGIPWHGETTLFDPVLNVQIGTRYLSYLHERYGSWQQALAAYNWGPARIDWRLRRGRALPVQYAKAVLERLDEEET